MAVTTRLSQCSARRGFGRRDRGRCRRGEGGVSTHPSPNANRAITPGSPGVSFGRTADGMLVALVGDNAYAMAPARDGRHFLASGWRIARPMSAWIRSDFFGHGGDLADEAAFRAK